MQIIGKIVANLVKEVIRIIDAENSIKEYAKEKIKYNVGFTDIDRRNAFTSKNVTSATINYSCRFNHHEVRDAMIN